MPTGAILIAGMPFSSVPDASRYENDATYRNPAQHGLDIERTSLSGLKDSLGSRSGIFSDRVKYQKKRKEAILSSGCIVTG